MNLDNQFSKFTEKLLVVGIVLVACCIVFFAYTIMSNSSPKQGERFVVTNHGNGIATVLDMQTGNEFLRCSGDGCVEIISNMESQR